MYVLTEESRTRAADNVARNGHHLVGIITTSSPYLAVVIASKIENNGADNRVGVHVTYTVWTMNLDQNPRECLNNGRYGLETLEAAIEHATRRL